MNTKVLFQLGNLYTGYPYGVEVEHTFGTRELHGPFASENEANTYAHQLVQDEQHKDRPWADAPYESVKVVRIELPQIGRHIVRNTQKGEFEYA